MGTKEDICPCCGRMKNDSYQNGLNFEEDITSFNFNYDINNIIDDNLNKNIINAPIEQKIKKDNRTYFIDNFNILPKKNWITNKRIDIENNRDKFTKNKNSKKLGRKIKRNNDSIMKDDCDKNNDINQKIHDRFSDDNMRKKCKNIVLKSILESINSKIKFLYNNDIGHGDDEKALKILNQKKEEKKDTLQKDGEFICMKLKDIFSKEISARYSHYSSGHNKKVIESLINDQDEIKSTYFNNLFNLTFFDYLKYFRGDEDIQEFGGFKKLSSVKEQILKEDKEEYLNHFLYYINNFEKIINRRKKN